MQEQIENLFLFFRLSGKKVGKFFHFRPILFYLGYFFDFVLQSAQKTVIIIPTNTKIEIGDYGYE